MYAIHQDHTTGMVRIHIRDCRLYQTGSDNWGTWRTAETLEEAKALALKLFQERWTCKLCISAP